MLKVLLILSLCNCCTIQLSSFIARDDVKDHVKLNIVTTGSKTKVVNRITYGSEVTVCFTACFVIQ